MNHFPLLFFTINIILLVLEIVSLIKYNILKILVDMHIFNMLYMEY